MRIRLGEHNTRTRKDCEDAVCAPPVQDFRPDKVISHEKFQQPAMRNDIALIRLDRPAKITRKIFYCCWVCRCRYRLLTEQLRALNISSGFAGFPAENSSVIGLKSDAKLPNFRF